MKLIIFNRIIRVAFLLPSTICALALLMVCLCVCFSANVKLGVSKCDFMHFFFPFSVIFIVFKHGLFWVPAAEDSRQSYYIFFCLSLSQTNHPLPYLRLIILYPPLHYFYCILYFHAQEKSIILIMSREVQFQWCDIVGNRFVLFWNTCSFMIRWQTCEHSQSLNFQFLRGCRCQSESETLSSLVTFMFSCSIFGSNLKLIA